MIIMDKTFFETLLSNLENPERIKGFVYNSKYVVFQSAENSNDTLGWFHINSTDIEKSLKESGYSWCYLFETAPNQSPNIYMFIGKGLTQETLEEELKDIKKSLPEGRSLYFEEEAFSAIDVDQYDNSMTVLEQELFRKASEVFRVYEP